MTRLGNVCGSVRNVILGGLALFVVALEINLPLIMDSKGGSLPVPAILRQHHLYPTGLTLLNLSHFRYVINNECSGNPGMVAIVTSHAKHFELRHAQRRAFPSGLLRTVGVQRFFLIANVSEEVQAKVEHENTIHGDLVQGNFIEHYHNLSYKHIMGLNWATQFCKAARFILKMDDDIMVNIYDLKEKLNERYSDMRDTILGYKQIGLSPQRDPKSKWFVSEANFPNSTYPDFVSGWAYVTTMDVATTLSRRSRDVPFFWIDDVWVTGILAQRIGIRLLAFNTYFTVYKEHIECCLKDDSFSCDFLVGPSLNDLQAIDHFGRLSKKCRSHHACKKRTWQESIVKTCVHVDNPFFLPGGEGVGEVFVIPTRV